MHHSRKAARILALVCVLSTALLVVVPGWTQVKAAQPDAYFSSVLVTHGNGALQVVGGGVAKVYSNQAPVWENTTFYNNLTSSAYDLFYQVIYVTSGNTTFSFTSQELNVSSSSLGSFNWYESGGFVGSGDIHIRIELWWNFTGGAVFEDAVQFDFLVVLLSVTSWLQSQTPVQRGSVIPATLALNFTNGGNDVMYNSTIVVEDFAGLLVQPYTRLTGNILPGQSAEVGFQVLAPLPSVLGPHVLHFRIDYFDFRDFEHSVNETAVVNLSKLGTILRIVATPGTIKVGELTSIKVLLVDGNGSPVANAQILLSVGSLAQVTLYSDSSGNAIYEFRPQSDSGIYLIRASYLGDSDLASSANSSTLSVESLATSLALNVHGQSILGQSVIFSATLTDEVGHAVSGANVTFIIGGTNAGWALTDESGVAVFYYFLRASGAVQGQASYFGDDVYGGASSPVLSLSVAPASLLVLWGIDLTLPLLVMGASAVFILTLQSVRARWEK